MMHCNSGFAGVYFTLGGADPQKFAQLAAKAVTHPLSKGFVDKLKEMFG